MSDLINSKNSEFHRGSKNHFNKEFDQLWNDTTDMIQKHGLNLELVGDVKRCNLSTDQQFKDITMCIFFQGAVEKSILRISKLHG